jgi:hypothetical protein
MCETYVRTNVSMKIYVRINVSVKHMYAKHIPELTYLHITSNNLSICDIKLQNEQYFIKWLKIVEYDWLNLGMFRGHTRA